MANEEYMGHLPLGLAAADSQRGGRGGAAGAVPGAVPVRMVQYPVQLGPLRHGVHQPHQRGGGQRGRGLPGAGAGGEHRRTGAAGTGEQRPDGMGVRGHGGGSAGRRGGRGLLRGAGGAGDVHGGLRQRAVRRAAAPADRIL